MNQSPPSSGEPSSNLKNKRPRVPFVSFGIVLLLVALVPVIRWLLFEIDHQFANIGGVAFSVLAILIGYIALWRWARGNWFLRGCLLLFPILSFFIGSQFVQFVGFTGESWPVFRWRQSRTASVDNTDKNERLQTTEEPSVQSPDFRFESKQFLGRDRNGIIDSPEFSVHWDARLPDIVWKKPIGAGWSSFAVASGLAITLEQLENDEAISAYRLTDGELVWQHRSTGKHFELFGGLGPRSTPTIVDDQVYALTALGKLHCLKLKSGELIWSQDLLAIKKIDQATSEAGVKWGRSASPLVFENRVYVPLGGSSSDTGPRSLIAFDAKTGDILWQQGTHQITYASPVLLKLCGAEQIVCVNEGAVTSHDPKDGSTLWSTPWDSHSNADACCSQPVQIGDNRLLISKGYAAGSKMIELSYDASQGTDQSADWKVKTVWANNKVLKTKFTSALYYDDRLYGLSDGVLECVDPSNGNRIWRGKRYGQGQALIVNGKLLITAEDGLIALVDTDPQQKGKAQAEMQVLEGVTWNVPTIAGDYLLMRNAEYAACLRCPQGPATNTEIDESDRKPVDDITRSNQENSNGR